MYAVPYQHYTNAIERYFNVLKSRLQKKKGLTYNELVNNVKDILDEIPIHIYKNLIKGAYDRNEKYVNYGFVYPDGFLNIFVSSLFAFFYDFIVLFIFVCSFFINWYFNFINKYLNIHSYKVNILFIWIILTSRNLI